MRKNFEKIYDSRFDPFDENYQFALGRNVN